MPQSLSMHWLEIVVTLVCGLNVALVMYLIRKSGEQGKDFTDSLEKISNSIPIQLDKAIERFDELCKERQSSCSSRQDVQVSSMCSKLTQYASANDAQWIELARRREQVWENHKIEMSKIWDAIHDHSHTEKGKVIR